MQKSFIRHIFTVSILSCCLLFGGCSQNSAGEETSSATTASPSPSETVAACLPMFPRIPIRLP